VRLAEKFSKKISRGFYKKIFRQNFSPKSPNPRNPTSKIKNGVLARFINFCEGNFCTSKNIFAQKK